MTGIAGVLLSLAAAALPASRGDDGLAPPYCWHTAGGSAARTGASGSAPVRQPVEVAWRHEAGGVIEGEPLVWDDWILLSIRHGPGSRSLRALDLYTGEPLLPDREVGSKLPLEPSIWRDIVVFRADEHHLLGLRRGPRRFYQMWSWRDDEHVGPPLVVGSEVYVVVGDDLCRLVVGRDRPRWKLEGRFRGRASISGELVYALGYDSVGKAMVRGIDRATGTERWARYAGHHGGRVPEPGADVTIQVMPAGLFVHFEDSLTVAPGREIKSIGIPEGEGRVRLEPLPGSVDLLQLPAAWNGAWLGALVDGDGEHTFVLKRDPTDLELRVLATERSNPDFIPDRVAVTTAGPVGFVGARAFDLETSRVLWRLPIDATSRAVLARDTVLVVEGETRLVAIRSSEGRGGADTELTAPELVEGGLAVLRDGSILRGTFGVDVRAEHVGRLDDDGGPWHMGEILLLEDARTRPLLGADVVRGVRAIVERELARSYVELASKARGTNDVELIEDMVREAWIRGADDGDLDGPRKAAETLRRRPGAVRRTRAREVRAQAEGLSAAAAQALWDRVLACGTGGGDPFKARLLRALLLEQPDHGPAREMTRLLIPTDLRPARAGPDFDTLDWLSFVEATQRAPIRVVRRPDEERRSDPSQRILASAARSWRGDLTGFESEHLLIISPVHRPGALARCLTMGELVCGALEQIFAQGGVEREARERLVLHLYETKQEYLEHGPGGGSEGGAGLTWTAGHYDQQENVSRIFVPDRAGAFETVMETYAHELTHHWLRMQCPMFPYKPFELADATQPGYWVVEGFASLVDEFRFDLERGTWHPDSPQSRRLDLVANAAEDQLFPWKDLYVLSHLRFTEMSFRGEPSIPSTCFLGLRHVVSARHMFYAQAAATSRYLFESEQRRGRLLAYLTAFYTNDRPGLDVQRALGLDAEELGREVVGWSRRTLGVRPGTGR